MFPISSEGLNRETDQEIYFFTPAFEPLDNFSAFAVELWGQLFPTAEHAFQWKKFSQVRPDIAASILAARSPEAGRVRGRMCRPWTWMTVFLKPRRAACLPKRIPSPFQRTNLNPTKKFPSKSARCKKYETEILFKIWERRKEKTFR